ncbi:alcohol dehydrogenase [Penicillium verhagenii]|nr:alcohol dehydrogenase [Penicillium verhagenii]
MMASFDIPRSMRALEYSAARQFSIVQKPLPEIRDHDVLFRLVPGHETVGTVAALSASVHGFTPGDRVLADNSELCGTYHYCRLGNGKERFCSNFIAHGVMIDGGFAEYCLPRAPEPAVCAAHGIDRIAPAMNSRVLDFGAGPTGLMLAQLLRLNGASHLGIAAPAGLKIDLTRELDAAGEYLVLSRDGQAGNGVLGKLQGENPYGVEVVVEATGNANLSRCILCWWIAHSL